MFSCMARIGSLAVSCPEVWARMYGFFTSVYYVTMQITFHIPEFAREERNLHCDVVHITAVWVSRLLLDHAMAAIQTSR